MDFYCPKLRLAIEIDGKTHESQKDYDQFRQSEIKVKCRDVIRVKNDEIFPSPAPDYNVKRN